MSLGYRTPQGVEHLIHAGDDFKDRVLTQTLQETDFATGLRLRKGSNHVHLGIEHPTEVERAVVGVEGVDGLISVRAQ